MRKIYFYDNGIRNAIIDNFKPIELRADVGALWENFIVCEMIKKYHYDEKSTKSWFWRSLQQQEVDYVESEGDELRAYEIKWNSHKKAYVTKAFTNMYPHSITAVITPDNFTEFVL
jgi:predicted AAA+ superfamily ATPase